MKWKILAVVNTVAIPIFALAFYFVFGALSINAEDGGQLRNQQTLPLLLYLIILVLATPSSWYVATARREIAMIWKVIASLPWVLIALVYLLQFLMLIWHPTFLASITSNDRQRQIGTTSTVGITSQVKPSSKISTDISEGTAPLLVSFTPTFMGLGTKWIEFGDGNQEPVTCAEYKANTDACIRMNKVIHTYESGGIYTAIYKEQDVGAGGTTEHVIDSITVTVR